jgi:hypothetical protein
MSLTANAIFDKQVSTIHAELNSIAPQHQNSMSGDE